MTQEALPQTITGYLAAHRTHDADAAIAYYTGDATVVDDGRTYRGTAEILKWLRRSSTEYAYTTKLIGAARLDDDHYVATNHLEGDFPGGTVDLDYRFTLRDGHIAHLTIEAS